MPKFRLIILFLLIALFTTVAAAAARPLNFRAHLSGAQENPPVETSAQGQSIFQLDSSGTSLDYKLNVANIDDVFAAHIHCGAVGVNGPAGITLFFAPPPNPGRVSGTLAEGSISAPNVGNGCGWESLWDVVAAMESGETYVNVHTLPGVPSGEIRGQIR